MNPDPQGISHSVTSQSFGVDCPLSMIYTSYAERESGYLFVYLLLLLLFVSHYHVPGYTRCLAELQISWHPAFTIFSYFIEFDEKGHKLDSCSSVDKKKKD